MSMLILAMLLAAASRVLSAPTDLAAHAPPLRVVYFHSPSCHDCILAKQVLAKASERWGPQIAVELHSLDEVHNFEALLRYEEQYGVTVAAPPAVFVGDRALAGLTAIRQGLPAAVEAAITSGTQTFALPSPHPAEGAAEPGAATSALLSRFESFAPGAVAVAGLIDGVNPCAFTTIVFFLSMLAYLKKTRRQMLAVGLGFAAGMFGAYLLLGLGLLGAVRTFSVHHGLSTALTCGVAAMAFALAGWSLLDAVRYMRSGDTRRMTLGLPLRVKQRIHAVIRTRLKTRSLVAGSVSIGFAVSLLESLCTGQVYLPTIVFVAQSPQMRPAAIAYLLLYNIAFILPLLAILTAAVFGVSSQRLAALLTRRLVHAKLAMAALFTLLGMLTIATVFS